MVRYPQKDDPQHSKPRSEPVSAIPEQAIREVKEEIVQEQRIESPVQQEIKEKKNEEVEALQQRLLSLEEKLKNIERHGQHPPQAQVERPRASIVELLIGILKRYRIIIVLVITLGLLGALFFVVKQHLVVASITVELNTSEFYAQNESPQTLGEEIVRLERTPDVFHELLNLKHTRIIAGKSGNSFQVMFYSFGARRTRQLLEKWQEDFVDQLGEYRKKSLTGRLNSVRRKYHDIQRQLIEMNAQFKQYALTEEYFLVNEKVKRQLIKKAQQDAIALEKEFMLINEQLERLSIKNVGLKFSPSDAVLMTMYQLRLTDIEFKALAVHGDSSNVYGQGLRAIKSAAAKLINEQARRQGLDEMATSLTIKGFFLNSRREAMQALLNKRYVVSLDELSGRLSDYVRMKEGFEDLYFKLGNAALSEKRINGLLEKSESEAIIIRSPVTVHQY